MPWISRSFPVEICRELELGDLADVSSEELAHAEEEGWLAGNRSYRDMRGFSWDEVRTALDLETDIINQLKTAEDPRGRARGLSRTASDVV